MNAYTIYNLAVVVVALVANIVVCVSNMPAVLKVALCMVCNLIAFALLGVGFFANLAFGR
jgi:hypothetical protein